MSAGRARAARFTLVPDDDVRCTLRLAKIDVTPPTVSCRTPEPVFLLGEDSADVTASVADEGSGPDAETARAAADTSTVGAKTVRLTGRDRAGNETSQACGYRVEYRFERFIDPVENPPSVNTVRAGRVVPLKWRLTDAAGAPVTDLAAATISAVTVACDLGTTPDRRVEETAGSGLQNLGDGYYQLNWRVPSSYAGSCKTMRLDLGEGAFRTALFRLR
jgi:hypothetical protein